MILNYLLWEDELLMASRLKTNISRTSQRLEQKWNKELLFQTSCSKVQLETLKNARVFFSSRPIKTSPIPVTDGMYEQNRDIWPS